MGHFERAMSHYCASSTIASTFRIQRLCGLRRIHNDQILSVISQNKRSRFSAHHQPPRKRHGMDKRFGKSDERANLEDLVKPQLVPIEKHPEVEFDGVSSKLTRQFVSSILDQFAKQPHIRELAAEQNISKGIFEKAFQSFRLHCCSDKEHVMSLEPKLRVTFSDIQNQEQSVDSLYPFFVKHAHRVFPHLECIDELQRMSDLTKPHNWYPLAREIHRKIVFHAGPTNSGKTYEALQVMKNAESGMYCGPLRLLAYEIYERINKEGIPCDLITGERRLYAHGDKNNPAAHCAFTVEMCSPMDRRAVCIIDEIQLLRDRSRGAAWTKALLGAAADEVHLCGEEAAIEIVQRLLDPIGEHVDVRRYSRKGDLVVISTHGLGNLANVQDGDCLIHFAKSSILQTAKKLKLEHQKDSAIIFGDLPPETKKEQITRFNDPDDPCKLLLATDAVGMGMNLNIKRVIFTTLMTTTGRIFPSHFVKQIAGRAGRFASRYCTGEVMTLFDDDAKLLARLMDDPIEPIKKAGIAPSYDMIEMFSMLLPHCTLVQLIDIFISIATITDDYFVGMSENIRELAMIIEHIPLSLKDRWFFSTCPVSSGNCPFLNASYVKMVRRYSQGNAITIEWVRPIVEPVMKPANTLSNLNTLVEAYDFLYTYLWLSYKFEDYFVHREAVRELQSQCADYINESLKLMVELNALEKMKETERKTAIRLAAAAAVEKPRFVQRKPERQLPNQTAKINEKMLKELNAFTLGKIKEKTSAEKINIKMLAELNTLIRTKKMPARMASAANAEKHKFGNTLSWLMKETPTGMKTTGDAEPKNFGNNFSWLKDKLTNKRK